MRVGQLGSRVLNGLRRGRNHEWIWIWVMAIEEVTDNARRDVYTLIDCTFCWPLAIHTGHTHSQGHHPLSALMRRWRWTVVCSFFSYITHVHFHCTSLARWPILCTDKAILRVDQISASEVRLNDDDEFGGRAHTFSLSLCNEVLLIFFFPSTWRLSTENNNLLTAREEKCIQCAII